MIIGSRSEWSTHMRSKRQHFFAVAQLPWCPCGLASSASAEDSVLTRNLCAAGEGERSDTRGGAVLRGGGAVGGRPSMHKVPERPLRRPLAERFLVIHLELLLNDG